MLLLLKIVGGILSLGSVALICFFLLCFIPEGDPLPKKDDTLD